MKRRIDEHLFKIYKKKMNEHITLKEAINLKEKLSKEEKDKMYKENIIKTLKELTDYLTQEDIEHKYLIRFNHYTDKLLKLKKNREHIKSLNSS